jgi:zinc finger SWIM domain-containing protein 3
MKFSTGNFLNNTNNRLESINQKLKSVIPRFSSLEDFIEKFFVILRVLRSEREHRAALTVQKVPVVFHTSASEGAVKYMKYLTPYGYQYVAKQLNFVNKVKLTKIGNNFHVTSSNEGELETTPTACTCCSWLSMKLPCRHIFAVRIEMGLDVYDEILCDKRWSMDYYKESQSIFQVADVQDASSTVEIMELPPPKTKTLSQVFWEMEK